MQPTLAFMNFENPFVIIIVCIVGILVFGKRLPEMGKNLGKSIVEFKRGLKSTGDEVDKAAQEDSAPSKPAITSSKQPIKQIAAGTDEP